MQGIFSNGRFSHIAKCLIKQNSVVGYEWQNTWFQKVIYETRYLPLMKTKRKSGVHRSDKGKRKREKEGRGIFILLQSRFYSLCLLHLIIMEKKQVYTVHWTSSWCFHDPHFHFSWQHVQNHAGMHYSQAVYVMKTMYM